MSIHTRPYKGLSDDWITPKFILDELDEFDLDPCSSLTQPWPTAKVMYTIEDDGFNKEWHGRIWLNPPYGPQTYRWMQKLSEYNNGTALIFARTETKMFFDVVWNKASSILFIEGRLYFHRPDGTRGKTNAGGPSCLISYGDYDAKILKNCNIKGKWVVPHNNDIPHYLH